MMAFTIFVISVFGIYLVGELYVDAVLHSIEVNETSVRGK